MIPETIASVALIPMILYVLTKNRILGFLSWFVFAIATITKSVEFTQSDHFNAALFFLGGIFFLLFARSLLQTNSRTHLEITAFSAISSAIYFPFVFFENLREVLIEFTAYLTCVLGNAFGYPMLLSGKILELENSAVEVILPCTAIESVSLFSGATLGIKAEFLRKFKAFLISVPTIYFLNLLRNVFVIVSYAYSWFGENSFYIAHHVVSKILATISLMLLAYAVFRMLPELAELIYSVKSEIARGVRI